MSPDKDKKVSFIISGHGFSVIAGRGGHTSTIIPVVTAHLLSYSSTQNYLNVLKSASLVAPMRHLYMYFLIKYTLKNKNEQILSFPFIHGLFCKLQHWHSILVLLILWIWENYVRNIHIICEHNLRLNLPSAQIVLNLESLKLAKLHYPEKMQHSICFF